MIQLHKFQARSEGTSLHGMPSQLQVTTGSSDLWMMCLSFIAPSERWCGSGSDSLSASTCVCNVPLRVDLPPPPPPSFEHLFHQMSPSHHNTHVIIAMNQCWLLSGGFLVCIGRLALMAVGSHTILFSRCRFTLRFLEMDSGMEYSSSIPYHFHVEVWEFYSSACVIRSYVVRGCPTCL